MNYARVSALVLTVLISGGSFTVSFAALTDLAAHHGITPPLAQVWALIVDMTIVAATIARLVMPTSKYSAGMLITAAAVAVAGNMLHAAEFGAIGVAIAVVPPAALLGTVHLCVLLSQHRAAPAESPVTGVAGVRPDWLPSSRDTLPDMAHRWRKSSTDPQPETATAR